MLSPKGGADVGHLNFGGKVLFKIPTLGKKYGSNMVKSPHLSLFISSSKASKLPLNKSCEFHNHGMFF